MTISKKEITSLIEKFYSRLHRRILVASTLQSAITYNIETGNLIQVENLITFVTKEHLKINLNQDDLSYSNNLKRLERLIGLVDWTSLARKYCKSLDSNKDKDPIDIDSLYDLTEKYFKIEFKSYDWDKIISDLTIQYQPSEISLLNIFELIDQDDIYSIKNKKAKLAPDWFEASCDQFGLLGVFKTQKEAKDCFDLYKKNNKSLGNLIIKPVRCLPPGKYFIGDLGTLLDDYENQSKYPDNRDVYQLEDGTIFANFHTWAGDGIYQDETGWEYGVDTGSIGAIPIKALPKELRNIKSGQGKRIRIFKHPATCSYNYPFEGCIKIGNTYIFTSLDEISKEKKKSLFLEGYERDSLLDRRKSEEGKPNSHSVYGYKTDVPNLDTTKNQIDQIKGQRIGSNTQLKQIELDLSILDSYDLDNLKLPNFRNILIKDIHIESLSLSVRSFNILMRNGFEYINDLSGLTYYDFLEMPNLGSNKANEIIIRLHEKGYISKESILEIPVQEEPIREIWSSGDKVIHHSYGPGRLIGSNAAFIVVRFEHLKRTYRVDPYTPAKINQIIQIISKKIYPYTYLEEQSSLKEVEKISEDLYEKIVSNQSEYSHLLAVEIPFETFEKEWECMFKNIPSSVLSSNIQNCIGSLVELFKRHKEGIEVFDDQNNPLNDDYFIERIDNTIRYLKESFNSRPKVLWLNKYGEIPPKNNVIEVLNLSTRTYNCLKRNLINSLSDLALMGYEDFLAFPGMGSMGPDEIPEKFEEIGFSMKLNEAGQKLIEFCPEYQWANIKSLKKLGFDFDK